MQLSVKPNEWQTEDTYWVPNLWAKFPRILSQNGQNDPVQFVDPNFQYQSTVPQDACLVHIWCIKPKSMMNYSRGQTWLSRILSENDPNDLEGQCQRPLFSKPAESTTGWIYGFGDPSSNLWRVIVRTNGVYGRADGQTDWQITQRQYPFGLKAQGVKIVICPQCMSFTINDQVNRKSFPITKCPFIELIAFPLNGLYISITFITEKLVLLCIYC